jgi:hypothetical protein
MDESSKAAIRFVERIARMTTPIDNAANQMDAEDIMRDLLQRHTKT